MMTKNDNVNHPSHYNQKGIETIEIIKQATGDCYTGFLFGNVIKYMDRAEFKGNYEEDLNKAKWYAFELIKADAEYTFITFIDNLIRSEYGEAVEEFTIFRREIEEALNGLN